ncbi:hypothetical protein [Paenibacillus chungangensis]|uniref:Uncharacterized protein n=1 Tax=Paenibacillus chungangensis TaxID=696535 RepID=A0ABW3HKQ3_9BACL
MDHHVGVRQRGLQAFPDLIYKIVIGGRLGCVYEHIYLIVDKEIHAEFFSIFQMRFVIIDSGDEIGQVSIEDFFSGMPKKINVGRKTEGDKHHNND